MALFLCLAAAASWLLPMRSAADVVFDKGRLQMTLTTGEIVSLDVEWALTADQRARGLMGRERLADDEGMLFDFGVTRMVTMWMENTILSLDMVFIDEEGRVVRVAERTVPFSRDIVGSGVPVRYVLEIRAGRASELGIAEGARLVLPLDYATDAKP
ncbi:DUF192 domain-containing protein [Peteryoungia ipomoeae]|uniref:DUF192 domain-containing protein n=1 Tax=Peteryoungia ipomoeae TaxID=1210932 RepID=UPI001FEB619B|nr:DUF192 domain-containing protein [Peteryoungia ipomoeae]